MARTIRFTDDAGFAWSVCEVPARRAGRRPSTADASDAHDSVAARGHERHGLYFFSRYATKRLAAYPPGWGRMSPADLARLCAGAETLRAVTRITGEHAIPLQVSAEPGLESAVGATNPSPSALERTLTDGPLI